MADPDNPPTPTDPPADPPKDPAPTNPPSDPAAKQPPWGKPEDFDPEKAWELIQNLRTEKGDPEKVAALQGEVDNLKTAQQKQMDDLAKALGLKSDDTPPDPAKLAEEIKAEQGKTTEATSRAESAERKLAVFLAAGSEANGVGLIDSSSFMASIKDIDVSDTEKLSKAIADHVEKNPHLKASPTPGTPPYPGGPRTPAPQQAGSMGEAIAARLASNTR